MTMKVNVAPDKVGEKAAFNPEQINNDLKLVGRWSSEERRQYMNEAMKKHRIKKKRHLKEISNKKKNLEEEVNDLFTQLNSLQNVCEKLRKQQKEGEKSWINPFLMRQNEVLRSQVIKLTSERYIYGKFVSLKQYIPCFNPDNFQKVFCSTLKSSFDILNELNVDKHGRVYYFSKQLNLLSNRGKMKREVNKVIKAQEAKYGRISLKSIFMDEDRSKLNSYTMKVSGVDFVKYTDLMFDVYKYNMIEDSPMLQFYDIKYDVTNFDTSQVPFYCPPELRRVNFPFQAVNISYYQPKFKAPSVFMITALYRNKNFALLIKSAMFYNEDGNSFSQFPNGLTCSLISQSNKEKGNLIVRASQTYMPADPMIEILKLYKGIAQRKKTLNYQ
eukprot:snap_masked-scaffold_6-processed-gene-1.36-mRNA-1 protein AED:0.31 eAED:1.00 QI:0/-1/0/1/-1/1/1/0/385